MMRNEDDVSVAERIEQARKRRREREMTRLKSLGDSSDEDEASREEPKRKKPKNDTLSWIEKSRKLEKEKRLLEQREKELLELERSSAPAQQDYTERDLKGIKITHNKEQFGSEQVILTLKDKSVLDESDDELENVHLIQEERRGWNKKQSQHRNKLADAAESLENQDEDNILPYYNNVDEKFKAKSTYTIGDEDAQQRLARLKSRLSRKGTESTASASAMPVEYSLDDTETKNIATDYLTREEAAQKVKVKKRKSKRKKSLRETAPEQPTPVQIDMTPLNTDDKQDHGSRQSSNYHEREEEARKKLQSENLRAYAMGIEKAKEISKVLYENNLGVDDEEDAPILRKRQNRKRAEEIVEESMHQFSAQEANVVTEQKNTVIFNSTAEFAKQIELKTHDEPSVKIKKEPIEGVRSEVEMEVDETQQMPPPESAVIKKRSRNIATRESRVDEDESEQPGSNTAAHSSGINATEDTKSGPIVDEPIVGSGLAAALQFIQQKGMITDREVVGRRKDKVASKKAGVLHSDDIDDDDIIIEYRDRFGRLATPKQAYRQLSHKYHGEEPGKNKLEKERQRYLQELKIKQMSNIDTPLRAMEALERVQKATNLPYAIIDEKNLSALASAHVPQEEIISNKEEKQKKKKSVKQFVPTAVNRRSK